MDRSWQEDTWLLLDAAGPESIAGLVSKGRWLALEKSEGDFLEWHDHTIRDLLRNGSLELADLAGVIYGSGPGSSLGIRLAAMFVRTLMQMPSLQQWRCLQYQNLELALAVRMSDSWKEAVAPWRRDCLHHTRLEGKEPLRFKSSALHLEEGSPLPAHGILLGRRPANHLAGVEWHPFPADEIPETLGAYPELLAAVDVPRPYVAEEPGFIKWSPQRHGPQ